jgi:hypothetical protein
MTANCIQKDRSQAAMVVQLDAELINFVSVHLLSAE